MGCQYGWKTEYVSSSTVSIRNLLVHATNALDYQVRLNPFDLKQSSVSYVHHRMNIWILLKQSIPYFLSELKTSEVACGDSQLDSAVQVFRFFHNSPQLRLPKLNALSPCRFAARRNSVVRQSQITSVRSGLSNSVRVRSLFTTKREDYILYKHF